MKILHVIPAIALRYGGPSQAIIEMCWALQCEGTEVLIATTDADGECRLAVRTETQTVYRSVPTVFFRRQLSETFKYSHYLACWLDKNVDSFDVVHIHAVFSHSSIAAARACARKKIPYIVRPLGSLDPWSLKQKRLAKRILWRLGVKRMFDHASAVHYTTTEEKRLAENGLGINSGVVVPLGVQQNSSTVGPVGLRLIFPSLESSPYALLLSRIHHKKNIESLLHAFSSVAERAQHRDWKLVIAGDGEAHYVERLKQLARQCCGERVVFTGWLDGTRKADLLKNASLFVLPSYQENFGLSVLEAMASRVPVIVSTQVNLSEEIAAAGAGWVVDLEPGSLQQALAEAMADGKERVTRGIAGENLVRSRYTWPAVARELQQLYVAVVGSDTNGHLCWYRSLQSS